MACSQDEHEEGDRCCKKCPKGSHVSSHCPQGSNETECAPCSHGYYTDRNNYIENCLLCRSCDSTHHLEISKKCLKDSNTKCKCMKDFYCTSTSGKFEDHCEKCEPVTLCPPGQGVSVPPNSTHDTVCQPCPSGTFNSNHDSLTPCFNHTRCSDIGRHFISDGTPRTDAQCGDFMHRCHWMIPAGLWAGLILTLILAVVGGGVYLKTKRRRRAVITFVNSENLVLPDLPPDVIKYPKSPELQTLTHNEKLCAEEDDGGLECDGVSVNVLSEKCGTFSIPDTCMSFISEPYKSELYKCELYKVEPYGSEPYGSENYRSEPQEDDWPGL